jgi:hypothetical protein
LFHRKNKSVLNLIILIRQFIWNQFLESHSPSDQSVAFGTSTTLTGASAIAAIEICSSAASPYDTKYLQDNDFKKSFKKRMKKYV